MRESKSAKIVQVVGTFFKNLYLTFHMIRDYIRGSYREISRLSIAVIAGALLLMIASPIGYIPVLGQIDDLIVIILCLKLIEKDLIKYARYREKLRRKKL